jgi:glycosyltransferase 2 family protein
MLKKIILRVFLPLGISVLALYLAGRHVEWDKLKLIIQQARFEPFVLAIPIWAVAFWLRGLRWQILLNPFQKIKCSRLVLWQIGALFINSILPLRMGEITRAWWAGHKTGIAKSTVFSTIFVERILDVGALFVMSLGILLALGLEKMSARSSGLIYFGVAAVVVGGVVAWKLGWVGGIAQLIIARLPPRLKSYADQFLEGLQILRQGRVLAQVSMISFLVWTVDIGVLAILSRSVELDLSWLKAGFLVMGLILGVMIPAAPGAAGTYEAGGVAALALLGIDATLAFSFVFLIHVFQFALFTLLGIPILVVEGFNPKQLFKEKPSHENIPAA